MAQFESVVRPFVTVDTTPSTKIPTEPPSPVGNIVLQIGKSGSGRVLSGSYSLAVTRYMTKLPTEETTED